MLLTLLLLTPMFGLFTICLGMAYDLSYLHIKRIKTIALSTSVVNLFISLILFILYGFSSNQFQFVQEYHETSYFDFYLGSVSYLKKWYRIINRFVIYHKYDFIFTIILTFRFIFS